MVFSRATKYRIQIVPKRHTLLLGLAFCDDKIPCEISFAFGFQIRDVCHGVSIEEVEEANFMLLFVDLTPFDARQKSKRMQLTARLLSSASK